MALNKCGGLRLIALCDARGRERSARLRGRGGEAVRRQARRGEDPATARLRTAVNQKRQIGLRTAQTCVDRCEDAPKALSE